MKSQKHGHLELQFVMAVIHLASFQHVSAVRGMSDTKEGNRGWVEVFYSFLVSLWLNLVCSLPDCGHHSTTY